MAEEWGQKDFENAKDAQDCFTRIFTNLHEGGKDISQKHEVNKMKTDF